MNEMDSRFPFLMAWQEETHPVYTDLAHAPGRTVHEGVPGPLERNILFWKCDSFRWRQR